MVVLLSTAVTPRRGRNDPRPDKAHAAGDIGRHARGIAALVKAVQTADGQERSAEGDESEGADSGGVAARGGAFAAQEAAEGRGGKETGGEAELGEKGECCSSEWW